MRNVIHWMSVPALVCSASAPAWAASYLSIEEAQQAIFPGATLRKVDRELTPAQRKAVEKASGVRVRVARINAWKVDGGGWFIVDEVVGKHEFITYAVGIDANGAVKQVEIMDYRETHGGQVREERWRAQFTGKRHGASLKLDDDIRNISGATLSCRHITDGVKRLLATHELVLKN